MASTGSKNRLTLARDSPTIICANRIKLPRMHKIGTAALLCAALHALTPRAQADSGVPIWTNRYNGPGFSTDVAVSVGLDASGNVFVSGYSANSSLDLDYATIKYSNSG